MLLALNVQSRSLILASLLMIIAVAGATGGAAAVAPSLKTASGADSFDHVVNVGEPAGPAYSDQDTMTPVTVVPVGTTVRWIWVGSQTHSVTQGVSAVTGPEGFDSGERHSSDEPENGGSKGMFTVAFDETGVYKYYCQVHLTQHGVVIVV